MIDVKFELVYLGIHIFELLLLQIPLREINFFTVSPLFRNIVFAFVQLQIFSFAGNVSYLHTDVPICPTGFSPLPMKY